MIHSRFILHYSPSGRSVPGPVQEFAKREGYEVAQFESGSALLSRVGRAYPSAVIIDGSDPSDEALELCRQIKSEIFTAVVPVVVYVESGGEDHAAAGLEAGADEVLTHGLPRREHDLRIALALRRAERDVSVHPTTRLPGTVQIERDFAERIRSGERFGVCYADLDHFKEFNDRYGYHQGDSVILLTSRILRDVVRGLAPTGFVGHIGGDDFILCVPAERMRDCCDEILDIFDLLIALQYSSEDRERGSFTGKDRRGNTYEVPIMTLSIGVVTNEVRTLTHTAEISELAAEMKAYAKSFPGSLYAVDRRTGNRGTSEDARTDGGQAELRGFPAPGRRELVR